MVQGKRREKRLVWRRRVSGEDKLPSDTIDTCDEWESPHILRHPLANITCNQGSSFEDPSLFRSTANSLSSNPSLFFLGFTKNKSNDVWLEIVSIFLFYFFYVLSTYSFGAFTPFTFCGKSALILGNGTRFRISVCWSLLRWKNHYERFVIWEDAFVDCIHRWECMTFAWKTTLFGVDTKMVHVRCQRENAVKGVLSYRPSFFLRVRRKWCRIK